jgi:DNA-binding NarL/FixJ family response regulator
MKYKICIAEDHETLRDGLMALLSTYPEFEIIGGVGNGLELIDLIQANPPDVVLLDLSMPRLNGLESIPEIKKYAPDTRICVLTAYNTEEYVIAVLEAGADGYVLKDSTYAELEAAVKTVVAGRLYLSPGIPESVKQAFAQIRQDRMM